MSKIMGIAIKPELTGSKVLVLHWNLEVEFVIGAEVL